MPSKSKSKVSEEPVVGKADDVDEKKKKELAKVATDQIMADKRDKDVKDGTYVDKAGKGLEKSDEVLRSKLKPNNKYQLLRLEGPDRFRIVGKRGEWVSSVLPLKSASRIVNSCNSKDPEQKAYNQKPKPGKWRDEAQQAQDEQQ